MIQGLVDFDATVIAFAEVIVSPSKTFEEVPFA
jgi:hypothetical protein